MGKAPQLGSRACGQEWLASPWLVDTFMLCLQTIFEVLTVIVAGIE